MNNAINEIKNTLEGTNSRITEAKDSISEVEDRMVEINEWLPFLVSSVLHQHSEVVLWK